MLKNYLKTAFRYLWNHKVTSGINLIGLVTAMSVCYFAMLYVRFELSYDSFHEKSDRIYRLVTDVKSADGTSYESSVGAMGTAIQHVFPEVEKMTRIFLDYLIVQKDQEKFGEEKIAYADSSIFSVFTFPLLLGNPETVLNAPNTIVLTETSAQKYFGKENPLGKTLIINGNDKAPALITGVMKDIPQHSHIKMDMLVSLETLGEGWMNNWKRFYFYTYLLLPEDSDLEQLSNQFTKFIRQHTDQSQDNFEMVLEPLESIYLYAKPRGSRTGSAASGNIDHVYIFSLVAVLVLLIASFNFINLTTALSMQRAREIGVRKAVGASRHQLIFQFLMDALLLTTLAFVLSLLLSMFLLPLFNQLAGKVISNHIFEHIPIIGWMGLITLTIGLLSGMYPAFFLSGFQPIVSLRGRLLSVARGVILRKVLVVGQFAISMILIIATLVIYEQVDYMQNHALGFEKAHQLVIDFQFDGRVLKHQETIKQELMGIPGIDRVSLSSSIPGRTNHTFPSLMENVAEEMQNLQSDIYFIDHDFLDQYQIEVIAGRGFSNQISSDLKQAMLINETAAKKLGYLHPEDAVGKKFSQLSIDGIIIGVIKDFHFQSFQENIQPLALRVAPGFFTFMSLEISSENMQISIERAKNKWQKLVPEVPMIYFFADEAFNAQSSEEERFGKLLVCLSSLAVLISCLGLLALSITSTSQRIKEIGVRKVLGASVAALCLLLTKDDIKLILIALCIAIPIANYFAAEWLAHFAYRISISWWMFAIPGLMVLFIALFAVSGQTLKAARKNPVDSLKYE